MNAITRFDVGYAFLSNFHHSPIILPSWHPAGGREARTVEHAFQSAKTMYGDQAIVVLNARTPAAAKAAGRRMTLRQDWDESRVRVMLALLRLKFAPGTLLADLLDQTGHRELVEGNTWGDRYWGVVNGVGENWLGRCLMLVRAELDVSSGFTDPRSRVTTDAWEQRQQCEPPRAERV